MGQERVITGESQVPGGWVSLRSFTYPNYDRIKRAILRGKIDALCLYPDGRIVGHPRKWVNEQQVKELLDRFPARYSKKRDGNRQAEAVTAVQPVDQQSVPRPVLVATNQFRELIAAVDLLAMSVQDAAQTIAKRLESLAESKVAEARDY